MGSIGGDTLVRGARLLTVPELSYPTAGKFVPIKFKAGAAFIIAIIYDNPSDPFQAGAASNIIGYASQATVDIPGIITGIIPGIMAGIATLLL